MYTIILDLLEILEFYLHKITLFFLKMVKKKTN